MESRTLRAIALGVIIGGCGSRSGIGLLTQSGPFGDPQPSDSSVDAATANNVKDAGSTVTTIVDAASGVDATPDATDDASSDAADAASDSAPDSNADRTAPWIVAVDPLDGARSVLESAVLRVTFSEAMDSTTLTADSFAVSLDDEPVAGSLSYEGGVATFTPSQKLLPLLHRYTVTLSTALRDLASNALAEPYTFSFTTRDGNWTPAVRVGSPANIEQILLGVAADGRATLVARESGSLWATDYREGQWGTKTTIFSGDPQFQMAFAMNSNGLGASAWTLRSKGVFVSTHQTGSWTQPFVINDPPTYSTSTDVAIDAQGNLYLVWVETPSVSRSRIWFRRTSSGVWGAPLPLADESPSVLSPRIVVDKQGRILVGWTQGTSAESHVWTRRFARGAWQKPVRLENTAGTSRALFLAVAPNGNAAATWIRQAPNTPDNVWVAYAIGESWGKSERFDLPKPEWTSNSHVAIDAQANALVVCRHLGASQLPTGLMKQYQQGRWQPALPLDPKGEAVWEPRAVLDARGNGFAVWNATFAPYQSRIMARRFALGAWSDPIQISTNAAWMGGPEIGVDESGRVLVAWTERQGRTATSALHAASFK